jgi:hypothetical protein
MRIRTTMLLGSTLLALAGCGSSKLPVVEIPPPAMIATGYIAFARVNKHPARPPVSPTDKAGSLPGNSSNPDSSAAKSKILVGIAVPDQPGYLRSPYNTGAGMIDARGMPSGAEIYDSYSGNTILVP